MNKKLLILFAMCLMITACEVNEKAPRTLGAPQIKPIGSEEDKLITRKIRQSLMEDNTLSPNAQNVSIVTENGIVTLKGPILQATEKTAIERKARSVEGVKDVHNHLEVQAGDSHG